MNRNFTAAPQHARCRADIKLRDGSGAQCMRWSTTKAGYCWQHDPARETDSQGRDLLDAPDEYRREAAGGRDR